MAASLVSLPIMDPNRQDALVKLESELRVNLSLVGILPLLERTQDGDGGFMTREEKMSVEAISEGNVAERVSKIIDILRKKNNDAFDRFCEILKQSGNEVWEDKLRKTIDSKSKEGTYVGSFIVLWCLDP